MVKLILPFLVPLIIPTLWYYAAYQQEGAEFLDLVHEENVERMTGNMSYSSHVKPMYYNFLTLLSGYLPLIKAVFDDALRNFHNVTPASTADSSTRSHFIMFVYPSSPVGRGRRRTQVLACSGRYL